MWHLFSHSLIGRTAPVISGTGWFNFDALPPAALQRAQAGQALRFKKELAGKVVLIDFWDYSCIDCLNMLPSIKQWWERYQQNDFLVIGVHTPEFAFAAEPDKVDSAVLRFELSYPVVNDAEYMTWERYHNDVWPRRLLVDAKGKVRFDQRGAGDYQIMEEKIQELLRKIHPQLVFSQPIKPI